MIIDCALLYDSDHRKRCMREESCESNIRLIIDKLLIVLILFDPFFLRDKEDSIFFLFWLNFYPRMNGRWSCWAHLFCPHFDTMVYLVSINQSN